MSDLMANDQMKELFYNDAFEHINTIEKSLLELENNRENKDLLNDIFRGFHTLKGNAGLVNEIGIQKISHESENILDMLRKEEIKLRDDNIKLILDSLDLIKTIVKNKNSSQYNDDIENLIYSIKNYKNNGTQEESKVVPAISYGSYIDDTLILKEIIKRYLEIHELIKDLNIEDKYKEKILDMDTICKELIDIIPKESNLRETIIYLSKILRLLELCNVEYNKDGFEIIYIIENNIKQYILSSINICDKYSIISVNDVEELERIENDNRLLSKELVLLELRLSSQAELSFEEDNRFEILENIKNIYLERIRFISTLDKHLIKKSRLLREIGVFNGIIHENIFKALVQ